MPYLKSAGAQSVAVVSAHYLLVYQVNNLKKKGRNLLWVLPWCPYVSQVDIKYLSLTKNKYLKIKAIPHSRAATFMKGGIYFHPAHPGPVVQHLI